MIYYQEAIELILNKTQSFGQEIIPIEQALYRILAEDILAPRDFPPFNRSAMDGIAVRFEDLKNGIIHFNPIETIFAGQVYSKDLKSGDCYRIMTGAAVPPTANVVIRIEDVNERGSLLEIKSTEFKIFQNIAAQGQDLKTGMVAITKGNRINVATIGLIASLGKKEVKVEKLPVVNIITTGDEVIPLGESISPVQIYNSNLSVLQASLYELRITSKGSSHIKDDKEILKSAIKSNLNADILILTGGISAGKADYIPDILNDLDIAALFHKVAIKPGKPIWCGQTKNKTMVFALPGNPFSCLVTFNLFIKRYINSCMGFGDDASGIAKINFKRLKKSQLDEFFPVSLKNSLLHEVAYNGSGDIRLAHDANAIAWHPKNIDYLEKGTLTTYISL